LFGLVPVAFLAGLLLIIETALLKRKGQAISHQLFVRVCVTLTFLIGSVLFLAALILDFSHNFMSIG
jgi:hypothetical protein